MDDFWLRFIAWHVATEHPWSWREHYEAMVGYIREDIESLLARVYHDLFADVTEGEALTGLRALLESSDG